MCICALRGGLGGTVARRVPLVGLAVGFLVAFFVFSQKGHRRAKIRERTHWNIANISAKHPAMLGLCKQADLDAAITKAGGATQPEEQVSDISELP